MAESHPFSNAGLGMFGGDTAIAKQMSAPESFQEKVAKAAAYGSSPLAILANKALESLASAFPDASKQIGGIQGAMLPPAQGTTPVAPVAPAAPAAAVAPNVGVPPLPTDATAPTDTTSQYSIGGYRKFLRPGGFGTTTQ
jgi:hypothetical protein